MKYTAFISYNSKDDQWAKWLQRKLESYSMPVVKRNERDEDERQDEKTKHFRVFRYRSDLNTISLNEGLAKELDEARGLIVICSPNSARSQWVGMEIQHFISTGRKDRILPFIVSGTSYSNDVNECLNPVLKEAFPDGDILGVNIDDYGDDLRIYRKRKALVRTVSILLEAKDAYGYLWNRYQRRFWEGVALKATGLLLVLLAIAYAWRSNASFDCPLRVCDQTVANSNLPAPDSLKVSLMLDNEQKDLVLTSDDRSSEFRNIPGRYANSDVHLTFRAYGYQEVDTIIRLQRGSDIVVNIQRDDTYGILAGKVIDEHGQAISGARIEAEECVTLSSVDGSFELHIPLEKQKPYPHVSISKQGYKTEVYSEQPIGRGWSVVLLNDR